MLITILLKNVSFQLYKEWMETEILKPKQILSSIINSAPVVSGALIKAFWSEAMLLSKKNIHIENFINRNL